MSKNLLHEWRNGDLEDMPDFEPIQKKEPTPNEEWLKELANDPAPPKKVERPKA